MGDQLVADLMTTPVLTVAASDPANETAGAMAREDIKSVVVTDDTCAVDGIFTATDYMELALHGAEAKTVGDCMTTGVVTISPTEPVSTAAARMVEHDITHLPVVDDDQVTGIVTSSDLTPCLAEYSSH